MVKSENKDYWWLVGVASLIIGGAIALYALFRAFNVVDATTIQTPAISTTRYIPMAIPVPDNEDLPTKAEKPIEVIDWNRPKGETKTRVVSLTDSETTLGLPDDPLNWYSCNIYNAGPGSVYYMVNKRERGEAPIFSGQTLSIPFNKRDSIKRIYLKCGVGETATVYIDAMK